MNAFRPKLEILGSDQIDTIIEKAMDILKLLFVVCLFILFIYSIKVSNDYNKLVIELNELRRNATNCLGGLI